MVDEIVPFNIAHNAEAEAVDLLIEVQRLKKILDLNEGVDEKNYRRICLYLIKTADFMSDPDDYAVSGFDCDGVGMVSLLSGERCQSHHALTFCVIHFTHHPSTGGTRNSIRTIPQTKSIL
jgi:hypothetical protein